MRSKLEGCRDLRICLPEKMDAQRDWAQMAERSTEGTRASAPALGHLSPNTFGSSASPWQLQRLPAGHFGASLQPRWTGMATPQSVCSSRTQSSAPLNPRGGHPPAHACSTAGTAAGCCPRRSSGGNFPERASSTREGAGSDRRTQHHPWRKPGKGHEWRAGKCCTGRPRHPQEEAALTAS